VKRLKKILPAVFALLALLGASTSAYAQNDYEKLLDRGLTNDEAYSYSLVEEAEGAQNELEILQEALKFSPDVPAIHFKLARASLPNVFESLQYVIGGLKAYARNFWWSFSLVGLLFASLLISLAIAAAAIVIVRFPIHIPLLSHDINESKLKLLIPFILLLAALGGPLFFIAGALVVAGVHLKKLNKAPVYVMIVALAVAPLFVKFTNTLLSASSLPELKAIVAVNEGRDNSYALRTLNDSTSPEAMFSYALALKREGRYAEAAGIYSNLAGQRPGWKVLNNLANAYSAAEQPDKAKETYKKAADMESSAMLLYNLSQAYRGTLEYSTGDKYYKEASTLDRDTVSKYTAITSPNPNRFVIDATHSTADFWKIALKRSHNFISPFPFGTLPVAVLAVFLLVMNILFDVSIKSTAFRCSRCSKVVCHICSRDSRWGQMCPECYSSLVKVKDMDRQKRVSALLAAYEHKDKIKKVVRILSFLPPGIAQISVGKTLSGFIFLWAFAFCAVAIWLNPFIGSGLAGYSHSWLNVPLIVAMVVLYLSSTIYVNERLESGWL
jgi:tetratricopeptide (TPR) repeat protein